MAQPPDYCLNELIDMLIKNTTVVPELKMLCSQFIFSLNLRIISNNLKLLNSSRRNTANADI